MTSIVSFPEVTVDLLNSTTPYQRELMAFESIHQNRNLDFTRNEGAATEFEVYSNAETAVLYRAFKAGTSWASLVQCFLDDTIGKDARDTYFGTYEKSF